VLDGLVAVPAGDIKEPIADVDDIADVAVAALTDDRHDGELYEITGPRLLTSPRLPPKSRLQPVFRCTTCRSRSSSSMPACSKSADR
jgi:hypothetical protein